MLVFMLMSLGISAQSQVRWGDPTSAAAFVEVNEWPMNWSNRGDAYPVLSNPNKATVTYSSSNTGVATIDANSGAISPVAPGSTTITASVVDAPSASYTLTYTDDRGEPGNLGFGFSSTTASATYGDEAATLPSLNMGQLSGAAVTYSSSVQSVATVDNTGSVSIKGAGSTEINASFAGDDYVKPGSASYTLTVNPKEVGLTWGTTSFIYDGSAHAPTATATGLVGNDACTVTVEGAKTDAGSNYIATASVLSNTNYKLPTDNTTTFSIAKAASSVTTVPTANTLTYTGSAQALVTAGAASGGTMQYSLDNQTFAETVPTGTNVGSYTVFYKVVGDANHENAEGGQVVVTIAKADAVNSDLSFASATATATYGDATVTSPTLDNPHQLPLTWSSSNKGVATVNASGVVTIVGAGETVISAAFAGNDTYGANTISYTLTVNKFQPKITFASTSVTAKVGEGFTPPKVTTDPKDLEFVYTSSDENVAKVDASTGEVTIVGSGTTRITATFNATRNYHYASSYYDLTVEDNDYLLDPIEEDKDYKMEAKYFINDDGTEVDLSNVIINDILFTLKNQNSPEGDGFDPDLDCIVLNTVVAASAVNSLVEKGLLPGTDEYAAEFTGLTFLMPAGEGEIIVTSQELNGVYLMVKVGKEKPVAISMPEMGDYSIPYKSNAKTYVYLWNGGTNANGTRGKKSMPDTRVRRVTYKSAASDIQQVIGELTDDERWYNLNGLRITRPTKKGVYIHGNRKVVIK
jgi:hypothetical protein